MNRLLASASVIALAAGLVGCASKVPVASTAPVETRSAAATPAASAAGTPAQGAGAGQVGASSVASVDLTRNAQPSLADLSRFVYFDFDSFAVDPEFKPTIEGHAKRLAADRSSRLVIAGHADERGGREYNLALGQKRADAVARSIALLGGDASRIETKSYGEERPKADGSGEEAWSKNRRAELAKR